MPGEIPEFLLRVVSDLRRLQVDVGVDDLAALRTALGAGFGLHSDRALVELCVMLWASTDADAQSVRAVLARHAPFWDVDAATQPPAAPPPPEPGPLPEVPAPTSASPPAPPEPPILPAPVLPATGGALPPLRALPTTGRRLLLAPHFPLSRRMIGQAFRRLRRKAPAGPPVQLDVEATIAQRLRSGVATPPVLMPLRRNVAGLLMLIDRGGSMTPFHAYCDHVHAAITRDGGLSRVTTAWFHDTPVDEPDPRLAGRLSRLRPQLDPVLSEVRGSVDGLVYADPEMIEPVWLAEVVAAAGEDAAVLVLSDAGAARGRVDVARNLASVAFARRMREQGRPVVWLNPMPRPYWAGTSAELLARHVPMLPLNAVDLHRAVDVLRGRPFSVERAA